MFNEDGSCWVVFNGEILQPPVAAQPADRPRAPFKTSSDTETILHAYEE
jgi:asparagine synthase (glutamine-hydrolysing)